MPDLDTALVLFEQTLTEPTAEGLLALRDMYLERGLDRLIRPLFSKIRISYDEFHKLVCRDVPTVKTPWPRFYDVQIVLERPRIIMVSVSCRKYGREEQISDTSLTLVKDGHLVDYPIDVFLFASLCAHAHNEIKVRELLEPWSQWKKTKKPEWECE